MSIASDEAEKKYPAFSGDTRKRFMNMPFHMGYIEGRTAPVTEEEIKVAAREMRKFYNIGDSPLGNEIYAGLAGVAFDAARKQVSDEV